MSKALKFTSVHILGGRVNRPLIYRIAAGIGKKTKDTSSVLIMPWTGDLKTVSPRELPFKKSFSIDGQRFEAKGFVDNFGPPRILLLQSELFEKPLFDGSKSDEEKFLRAYFFARSAAELLRTFELPLFQINCHGTESALMPFLLRRDAAFRNDKVLFTVHHEETSDPGKSDDKKFFLDLAVFPERFFSFIPSLKGIADPGKELFFENEISLLKSGIYYSDAAFVLHQARLRSLFADDPTRGNFFRRMALMGKLSFLLGNEDMDLNHAQKAKLIVDICSEKADLIGPYNYSVQMPKKFFSGSDASMLINASASLEDPSAAKESLIRVFGPSVGGRIRFFPSQEGDPSGSGSALIHMLSKIAELRNSGDKIERPVIHLNTGGENVAIGEKRISLYEAAARQAGFIYPQLPNGPNRWILVMGNTTLMVPGSVIMSGSTHIKYRNAGMFLFAYPVDIGKKTDGEKSVISKRWGAVFADGDTGEIFSVRERPTPEEIEEGAEMGGGKLYLNLSDYAIREDVAKDLLDLYFLQEDYLAGALARANALHIVKHIIEPMVLAAKSGTDEVAARDEWDEKYGIEGKDAHGSQMLKTDWMLLFENALAIVKKFGGPAVGYSEGIFMDLRNNESRKKLGSLLDSRQTDPMTRSLKRFFDIPAPRAKQEAQAAANPEEENILTGKVDRPVTREAPAGELSGSAKAFKKKAEFIIGARHSAAKKFIEKTIRDNSRQIDSLTEQKMEGIIIRMKRHFAGQLFPWAEKSIGKEFIKSLPDRVAAEMPLEDFEGLFKTMWSLGQSVFADKKPHADFYMSDNSMETFLVTAEIAPKDNEGFEIGSSIEVSDLLSEDQMNSVSVSWKFPAKRYIFTFHRMKTAYLEINRF